MPNEPQVKSFAHSHRKYFFWFLVLVFLVALPSLIFYTTGYRLSFDNEETSVETTGGIYVDAGDLGVDVYLDEEQVKQPRLFRSAYYIKNITTGKHRIVVQSLGLHTWVKDLPVDPYMVTETASFNLPVVPRIRPITEYLVDDQPVYLATASSSEIFTKATSTVPVLFTDTFKIPDIELNEEYIFVESLFGTTSTSTLSVFEKMLDGIERFGFATTTTNSVATTSEVIIEKNDIQLIEKNNELYAKWIGSVENIPYYFCVADIDSATTTISNRYGEHVELEIDRLAVSTTTPLIADENRICRQEIKLDRNRQDVYFYDFFPSDSDLVLLQLEDGVYVTEIDDRAWQNTQLLYPGFDLRVVVENDAIFINDDDYYFEVITEIEPN